MAKEKVFIVLSHKHSVKKGTRVAKDSQPEWEATETIEFVNQLRNRHVTMSSAIGDYINSKMITGDRVGMSEYEKFDTYIRKKYAAQMKELDDAYKSSQVVIEDTSPAVVTDQFGNIRVATVFDR